LNSLVAGRRQSLADRVRMQPLSGKLNMSSGGGNLSVAHAGSVVRANCHGSDIIVLLVLIYHSLHLICC